MLMSRDMYSANRVGAIAANDILRLERTVRDEIVILIDVTVEQQPHTPLKKQQAQIPQK